MDAGQSVSEKRSNAAQPNAMLHIQVTMHATSC